MAQPAEDDFVDIPVVPPPTAPALALDADPLSSGPFDDDFAPSSSSQSSHPSPPPTGHLTRALLVAWQNELHSPSLLPYAASLIPPLQSHLQRARSALPSHPPDLLPLFELELARLDFVLSDYHRLRLSKAERHCLHLRRDPQLLADLSPAERKHVDAYAQLWMDALRDEFLNRVEGVWARGREFDAGDMAEGWDRAAHVVLRVVERLGTVDLSEEGEEEPMELNRGDVVIARYQELIQQLLHQGKIQLI